MKYNMQNIFTNRTVIEVYMDQHMRFRYLSHWGDTKTQGTAQLLACTKYRRRKIVKPKFRQGPFRPGPEGIKTFAMLNSAVLINVKMPTIVGILTFISRINTSYESFKARNTYLFQRFSFY